MQTYIMATNVSCAFLPKKVKPWILNRGLAIIHDRNNDNHENSNSHWS